MNFFSKLFSSNKKRDKTHRITDPEKLRKHPAFLSNASSKNLTQKISGYRAKSLNEDIKKSLDPDNDFAKDFDLACEAMEDEKTELAQKHRTEKAQRRHNPEPKNRSRFLDLFCCTSNSAKIYQSGPSNIVKSGTASSLNQRTSTNALT